MHVRIADDEMEVVELERRAERRRECQRDGAGYDEARGALTHRAQLRAARPRRARERLLEHRDGVPPAVARTEQHDQHVVAVALGVPDEAAPRAIGVAGLHALESRHQPEQHVGALERERAAVFRARRVAWQRGEARERRRRQHALRQRSQVTRARILLRRVEAAGIDEMRVGESPCLRLRVHPGDEARFAARDVLGERDAGVVGRAQHQSGRELGHGDAHSGGEPHPRAAGVRRACAHRDDRVRLRARVDDERRHQLG